MNPTPAASALPELLARWQQAPLRPPAGAAGDVVARLAGWLGWTDAIALSGAVAQSAALARSGTLTTGGAAATSGAAARPAAGADPRRRREAQALRAELDDRLAWLRTSRADGLAQDETWQGDPLPARGAGRAPARADGAASAAQAGTEFAPLRRHLAAEQRRMEQFVGDWRARLRQRLAAIDPALTAVAALDAVFEEALRERERHLLAQAVGLLEQRFLAARQAEVQALTAPTLANAGAGPASLPMASPLAPSAAGADVPAGAPGEGAPARRTAAQVPGTDPACDSAVADRSAPTTPASTDTAAQPVPPVRPTQAPPASPGLTPPELPAAPRIAPRRPIGRALASRQLAANARLASPDASATPIHGPGAAAMHKTGLPPAPAAPAGPTWRRTLADDALALLQAELALRWAPVAGLLELIERADAPAARASSTASTASTALPAPSPSRGDRPLPPAAPIR